MSEDYSPPPPKEPEVETTTPAPAKKRKVGFKLKMALLSVIERKRLTDRVDYKAICARHNVSNDSLRQAYSLYQRGLIDLGEPTTPEEKQIDARVQHELALVLVRRYKALILRGFEGLLLAAEDDQTNGKPMGWQKRGLPSVLRELKVVTEIQAQHEKGYASALEDMMAQRQREEKNITNSVTQVAQTEIIHANDEQRALHALGGY